MHQFPFNCIMIVDDSEVDTWLAETLIGKVGLTNSIVKFNTAASALNHLAAVNNTGGPDLILLDLIMPIQDGFDFLTKFEAIEQHEIAIYIVTASILTNDKVKASHFKSVKGFVIKPLVQNVLIELKRAKQQTDRAQ